MSYGVALRNGVPFTLGTIAALCVNATTQWNPLRLWPNGIATPGMWISPRDLTSQWQDYTGTTPVSVPGTVADSANPVGLALDIRAGATVLTDPGNHMLQSTSAARPLLSARVNLLTYTEDFSNAVWTKTLVTATATTITETTGAGNHRTSHNTPALVVGVGYRYLVRVKRGVGTRNIDLIGVNAPAYFSQTFILSGAGSVGAYSDYGGTATVTDVTIDLGSDGYYTCGLTVEWSAGTSMALMFDLNNGSTGYYTGDGVSSLEFDGIQWQVAPELPYQSVPGDGSTYASGPPIAQLYDGVDDGMATAAFSAGTLINGMDCMIVVRRDGNSQQTLGGLYQLDETKYFGVIGTDSGTSAGTHNGCGTPTIFVDDVEVANTRGALYDAIGVGEWHILEYRDLDMSAWVNAGFGYYASGYQLIGARGDILLYPSTASTTDKDAARQWLADYYGVTLP